MESEINHWLKHIDNLQSIPIDVKEQVKMELQKARFTGKVSKDLIGKLQAIKDQLDQELKKYK